jgi:hypothetical protein
MVKYHPKSVRNRVRFGFYPMSKRLAKMICLGIIAPAMLTLPAHPEEADQSLRLYAVHIVGVPKQSVSGYGVYLGKGLVMTAAHVAGSGLSHSVHVQIGSQELPSEILKRGKFPDLDLALLAFDERQLPVSLRLRRMTLCKQSPWPGQEVIVAIPEATARSHVITPTLLPRDLAPKFRTAITDVTTTGNSGSGVFDADTKCLLGIISAKIRGFHSKQDVGHDSQAQDVAKYFVPAPIIADFMPSELRF